MSKSHNGIPIVDLQMSVNKIEDDDEESQQQVMEELCSALKRLGFVYLINHGVSQEKIKRIFEISKQYFDLPEETKRKMPYSVDTLGGHLLYGDRFLKRHGEMEFRESFDRALCRDVYPPEIPDFKEANTSVVEDMVELGKTIIKLIAGGLGLPKETFMDGHNKLYKEGNLSMFRLMHYPPMSDVEEDFTRCGTHTDFDTLTLILQDDSGGLKAKDENGDWVQATPLPGAIVMNVGDLLEIWTGGQIKAIEHAVTKPSDPQHQAQSRYSMGLFFIPDDDAVIKPLVGDKDKYKPTTAKDYVFNRIQRFYN